MWKWFMLLGSGCLASRACGSECKMQHTVWLSHQERPRSNTSSLAHAQPACRLLVKTLSYCSQISSEKETELVLKLNAHGGYWVIYPPITAFVNLAFPFLVCKDLNQNLLNTLDVRRFCFTKKQSLYIFFKVFWGFVGLFFFVVVVFCCFFFP